MYTLARTEDLYPMAHETMHGHENARMWSTGVSRRLNKKIFTFSVASKLYKHPPFLRKGSFVERRDSWAHNEDLLDDRPITQEKGHLDGENRRRLWVS